MNLLFGGWIGWVLTPPPNKVNLHEKAMKFSPSSIMFQTPTGSIYTGALKNALKDIAEGFKPQRGKFTLSPKSFKTILDKLFQTPTG